MAAEHANTSDAGQRDHSQRAGGSADSGPASPGGPAEAGPASTGESAFRAAASAYPLKTSINPDGHLVVGGCDIVEVAERFGTPAYVYVEDDMRARAREYLGAFRERTNDFEVIYGSKALPLTAAYRLFCEEGLSVDVASAGELYLALGGGFEPERVFMHGNNKTGAELEYAFRHGVGCLVLDSFDEIDLVERLLDRLDRRQDVLLRVTPGVEASTHTYVQTGQLDSKFGFGLEEGLAERGVQRVQVSKRLNLVGLHAHIGSQIFELEPYREVVRILAQFVASMPGFECRLLNVGGGLGIAYTREDKPKSITEYVDVKVKAVEREFSPAPRVLIEPGRSLVGNAGVTVYRIGTIKEIPGLRTYVAVDGGMSDNLRPMLYGARYEALVANRANEPANRTATIAGMHCESGDILISDANIAEPRVGDLLVTPATGAYGHALANNYNGALRPPVVFCRDGEAREVVRREILADLAARDVG